MKTSIYLPDELAEQVRAHGISISEVTQAALRQAVHAAMIDQSILGDIDAVAERLRSTIDQTAKHQYEGGWRDGVLWAKQYATAGELAGLATLDTRAVHLEPPHSLIDFSSSREGQKLIGVTVFTEDPYWNGFTKGVGEVWQAVQPLLSESGGSTITRTTPGGSRALLARRPSDP